MSREYVLHAFRAPVDLHINYEAELNPQQLAAVTAPPGPSLVIAGAGSGKTRTLTYRVAFLLEQGIPAERVLLLTFTNKAAREMMRRVADLLGQELPSLWGGTFHSVGNRVLRKHARELGYLPDFTIMDREDCRHLVNTCIADSGIDPKAARFPKAEVISEIFSLALNMQKSIAQVTGEEYEQFVQFTGQIEELEKKYAARKRADNLMDFDDLLSLWLKLLQENQDVREVYQRRFQFILVDEYQDTNKLQADLIDLLAAKHHNLMVVGDDAQSIYAWRGANFQNILEFPKRYPEAKTYKIETNYRSTPEILQVANAAIKQNVLQFSKELSPQRKPGNKPVMVTCGDASQQACFVAQRALELRDEGVSLNNMAVLYRSHFHALELQLELTKRNIPFSITSGIRVFEQAHMKDAIAFLKLIANPRDELSFRRIVLMLPGVGGKGAGKLWNEFSGKSMVPDLTHTAPATGDTPIAKGLQACAGSVPKKATVAWAQLVATVAQLEAADTRNNASRMLAVVLEAIYDDYLKENYENYRSRREDLEQLSVFASQAASLEEFLSELSLLSSIEAEEDRPAGKDDEKLRLSTVHQAKGLEFDVVFVIMLCEGLFPSARSLKTKEGEEEERRLMYVSVTRARNELYLSYPIMRAGFESGPMLQHPSRFLKEIPTELVEEWNLRTF